MALQTAQVAYLADADATFQLTYDDQTLAVTSVSWTINGPFSITVTFDQPGKPVFTRVIQPGSGSVNLPGRRFTLRDDPTGPLPDYTLSVGR